jgi:gamma-glutamyltranspeptidase
LREEPGGDIDERRCGVSGDSGGRGGRRILAQGGNAFDAAIAVAFAQGVTNPIGCGIGGLAFIHAYSARHDAGLFLNASVAIGSAPAPERFRTDLVGRSERVGRYLVRGDPNQMGYASIMTPGFVAGMGELWTRFGGGRVPWADLVRPAAELAEDGFEVYPYLACYYTFEGADRPGYPDIHRKLANDPRAAALYIPEGAVPAVGDRLRQTEMGRTLVSKMGGSTGSRNFRRPLWTNCDGWATRSRSRHTWAAIRPCRSTVPRSAAARPARGDGAGIA